ncbi:MAG: LysM peptidoglycan-binding domain-containing protein [Thermodesulfobacteriota bacterium]
MKPAFFKYSLTLLLSTALLVSCTTRQAQLVADNDLAIVSPTTALENDPELLLVENESEICLTDELEELRQTGSWSSVEEESTSTDKDTQVLYDFPVVMNKQVEMYLKLFQNNQKKHFKRWLSRSSHYLPMIEKELEAKGLPKDLAYLAMIESGYNQRAYSRARAVGLWQFMKATGRSYNLKVDSYVDERRDAEKSTRAAVRFLGDLYREFGDWHLAVAAYNAGPGKINRGLRRYKADNFWSLAQHRYLKLETKRYVPKLIAAIIISRDPEKYGFDNIDYQPPLEFETMEVGPGLSLDAVAVISEASAKDLKRLNQELRKGKTPLNRDNYMVKIPVGHIEIAKKNMPRLHRIASTGYKTHIVRKGESLSRICRRYKVNKTTILKVNNLRSHKLASGTRLRVPYSTIRYTLLPEGGKEAIAAAKNNLVLHEIRPGDSLSRISKKYNVPVELIASWNGLRSAHRIRAGQQLALYIESYNNQPVTSGPVVAAASSPDTSSQRAEAESKTTDSLIVLSEKKKLKVSTESDTPQFSFYKVKNGDSLWTISRKFNISPKQIRRWNNMKSNLIHPGDELRLKNV